MVTCCGISTLNRASASVQSPFQGSAAGAQCQWPQWTLNNLWEGLRKSRGLHSETGLLGEAIDTISRGDAWQCSAYDLRSIPAKSVIEPKMNPELTHTPIGSVYGIYLHWVDLW